MAYIYMPLFFMVLGYGILYFAAKPFLEIGAAAAGLMVGPAAPNFEVSLTTMYDPDAYKVLAGETVDMASVETPQYETHYAQLASEAIGLDVPLYYGDSDEALQYGAGQYMGSWMPGFGGTILVGGHNQTFFRPFQDIELGDTFTITTNYGVYEYEVFDTQVLRYDDKNAFDLLQKDEEILVMYTCYPFTVATYTPERLFVYAVKIAGPDVVMGGGA